LAILEDEGALKDAEPKPALITNGTRERITVVPQNNKQEPCSVLRTSGKQKLHATKINVRDFKLLGKGLGLLLRRRRE